VANACKYVKSLEYNKAVIEYGNIIQVDPKDASVHYELGEVYLNQNEETKAALEEALEFNKEFPGHKKAQHALLGMS
jgi:tetratricopeptide (TPR) repeat protein